ncbi:MAG: D-2-hydroxyacid dehydrogenase [Pseudomonadota bacterium]
MRILVLEHAAEAYREYLDDLRDEITYTTRAVAAEDEYDVLLAMPDLAAEYLSRGGRADWIQSTWAGVGPLARTELPGHARVTGVKGVFGGQIAEYVFTYVLEEIRQPERLRQAQHHKRWQPQWPGTLRDRHMVIVGTGSIGRHIATVAHAFGMQTTGISKHGVPAEPFTTVATLTHWAAHLETADYVVVVLPDTPETKKIIDAEALGLMAREPMLINVGRGTSVDEGALCHALRAEQIRAAILDVFTDEPLPEESPLWQAPGVTITPHIAAVSHPADIAAVFRSNLERFRLGEPLEHVIDLARGY